MKTLNARSMNRIALNCSNSLCISLNADIDSGLNGDIGCRMDIDGRSSIQSGTLATAIRKSQSIQSFKLYTASQASCAFIQPLSSFSRQFSFFFSLSLSLSLSPDKPPGASPASKSVAPDSSTTVL